MKLFPAISCVLNTSKSTVYLWTSIYVSLLSLTNNFYIIILIDLATVSVSIQNSFYITDTILEHTLILYLTLLTIEICIYSICDMR